MLLSTHLYRVRRRARDVFIFCRIGLDRMIDTSVTSIAFRKLLIVRLNKVNYYHDEPATMKTPVCSAMVHDYRSIR